MTGGSDVGLTPEVQEARRLLRTYLRDHDSAALAAARRLGSTAQRHRDPQSRAELSRLHAEVEEDRHSLAAVMDRLDITADPVKRLAVVTGEQLGRLKPNGFLSARSPLTDVVELEALSMAVTGKLRLWETLEALGPEVTLTEPAELTRLRERAVGQRERLERLHAASAAALANG